MRMACHTCPFIILSNVLFYFLKQLPPPPRSCLKQLFYGKLGFDSATKQEGKPERKKRICEVHGSRKSWINCTFFRMEKNLVAHKDDHQELEPGATLADLKMSFGSRVYLVLASNP